MKVTVLPLIERGLILKVSVAMKYVVALSQVTVSVYSPAGAFLIVSSLYVGVAAAEELVCSYL